MSKLVIEKGVPIPKLEEKIRREYPLREMEIGDSFKVEYTTKIEEEKLYHSLQTTTSRHTRLHETDKRFLVKKYDKEFPKCIRVWRTN